MNILVTGGTGFIGSHLVSFLQKIGHNVLLLNVDISNKEEVLNFFLPANENIDAVVHLAGVINKRDKMIYDKINVQGTANIIEWCKRNKVGRFIFFSTIRALSIHHDPYIDSKKDAEKLVKNSGIPYIILRPSMVYGPGDKKNIGFLIRLAKRLPVMPILNFKMRPIFVGDLVRVAEACLSAPINQIVNVTGAETISFAQIMNALKSAGMRIRLINMPVFFTFLLKIFSALPFFPIPSWQIKTLLTDDVVSDSAWQDLFGLKATSFVSGLFEVLKDDNLAARKRGIKLLILTQKMDEQDAVLGFMHSWIKEFAEHCESVIVICLQKGICRLPSNVKVLSLGKETNPSRIKYLIRFYFYIIRERKNYQYVWAHMNPEYVLLGGWFWKLWKKKISLWYAHGHVNWILRAAEKIADVIFTSTKSGCRLNSKKIKVVGQGVDVNFFTPAERDKTESRVYKLLSVGRLAPVKDYLTLIQAVEILIAEGVSLDVDIIGGPILAEDALYLTALQKRVREKNLGNAIHFLGDMTNVEILPYLQGSNLFVNMSHTGSLDKAVLEAMAVGLPILTCNEALKEILGKYAGILMYPKKDYQCLADRIKFVIGLSAERRRELSGSLRGVIVNNHSTPHLINKIIGGLV